MDALKFRFFIVVFLLNLTSCGGSDEDNNENTISAQTELALSYSLILSDEILSDEKVSLSLSASDASAVNSITVESWEFSYDEEIEVTRDAEGNYCFLAPQVRKKTPISITANVVNADGDRFSIVAQSTILPNQPNLIVIFTDDQGYADLGAQNILNDIHTPNIDKLAANGAIYTNGYITAPQCTPSRAAMVTG